MSAGDISRLLAKVSSVLDDNNLWDLGINIDWETLYEIYKLDGIVGYYDNGYFNRYEIDVFVRNLLKKDVLLFKTVITYISNRYDLPILEEYLNDYPELFKVQKRIKFENNLDKNNLKMFISFSNKDDEEAEKIQNFFKKCGVDCFYQKRTWKFLMSIKTRFIKIFLMQIFLFIF